MRYALELVLRRKGIVYDAVSRNRKNLKSKLSENARKDFELLSNSQGKLSQLLLNKPEKMLPDDYQKTLNTLHTQIEVIEKRLLKESRLAAREIKQRRVTSSEIAERLPANTALVEFIKIPSLGSEKNKLVSRYLVFVLLNEGEVYLIDLGAADVLEEHIRKGLSGIKSGLGNKEINAKNNQIFKELYDKLWKPIKSELKSADKVFISPDGILNLLPFGALIDNEEKFLLENLVEYRTGLHQNFYHHHSILGLCLNQFLQLLLQYQ